MTEIRKSLRVLVITSEWPTAERPHAVPFVTREVDLLRAAGLDVDVFNFRGAKKFRNYLRARIDSGRVLRSKQYDVIHCQWGQSTLLAMGRGIPFVVTFRGSDLEGIVGRKGRYTFKGWVLKRISRMGARFASHVIVVSNRLAKRLPKGIPFTLVPSGIDLKLFRPIPLEEARAKLDLSKDKRLVLFAAAPDNPVKRFDLARAAVDLAKRSVPSAELVVVSRAPYLLMPYYMSACDALIVTSSHEGAPNVVKEALACGLPVVAVDVGDVKERVGPVEGCFVSPTPDASALAVGLEKILRDPHRVDGRKAVLSLDEASVTARVIAIYETAKRA